MHSCNHHKHDQVYSPHFSDTDKLKLRKEVTYTSYMCSLFELPYLRESSAHPFRGFLGPKNRARIKIDAALDARTKSETTISLSVGSL